MAGACRENRWGKRPSRGITFKIGRQEKGRQKKRKEVLKCNLIARGLQKLNAKHCKRWWLGYKNWLTPACRKNHWAPGIEGYTLAIIGGIHTSTSNYRQRGPEGKGVVLTTTLIAWLEFNPHHGHVVASLNKTLYDDYLCLVALNKQQIQCQEFEEIHKNIGSQETPKQVRIPPTTK